jgi:heptosyltransferase III
MQSNSIKKILIIIVSRIGDTLLTTPAIKSIENCYEGAEITVLGHINRYKVLQYLPFIHNIKTISKNKAIWMGRFGEKYDLAFVYGFDENLVLYALRVSDKVIAFKQNNDRINQKLYKSVNFPVSKSIHFVDIFLSLPMAMNIHETGKRLLLSLTNNDKLFAEKIIADNKLKGKVLIGIQAVSFPTKSYRDWPIEHFLELCKKVIDKNQNVHFLIYGGCAEKEKEKNNLLLNGLAGNATSFIGMPLRETAAIMSKTNLYIGVDTGPTHIMSTFDIPMVVLFHCQLKSEVYGALEHPCYFAIDHPDDKKCSEDSAMSDIPVKVVLDTVNKILEK